MVATEDSRGLTAGDEVPSCVHVSVKMRSVAVEVPIVCEETRPVSAPAVNKFVVVKVPDGSVTAIALTNPFVFVGA